MDGSFERFTAQAAVGTGLEVELLGAGGIIPLILKRAEVAGGRARRDGGRAG